MPVTEAGGFVSYENGLISYRPSPGFFGVDRFAYTVSEAGSVSATGGVEIHVLEAPSTPLRIRLLGLSDAGLRLHLAGTPNRDVRVERASVLEGSAVWGAVTSLTLDRNGEGELIVETGEGQGFLGSGREEGAFGVVEVEGGGDLAVVAGPLEERGQQLGVELGAEEGH